MCIYAQSEYAHYPDFKHFETLEQQVLPEDTALRTGVLDNGFTYYVYHSNTPENRAFFQLLVNGGSVLEKQNERGIAHFVEHMMFKGTRHFQGMEVQSFMDRNGIHFGHDSNAETGYNTVRYFLNFISTTNEQLMDSCLLLLRDWARDATIDKKDVESEHNIIVEEWRARNTVSCSQQMVKDLFNGSVYTQRNPIGDMDIVQKCSAKLVKGFYKRWYQPQNQAIIVVGDFDADEMVEKVRNMFGYMKRGRNITPVQPIIPDMETPKVSFYKESKFPYVCNSLIIRLNTPEADIKTVASQRTLWIRNKISDILRMKLETINKNNKDILEVVANYSNIADLINSKILMIGLGSQAADSKKAYELLAKQIELIRRRGFKDEDWKEKFLYNVPIYNEDSTKFVFIDSILTKDVLQSEERANRFFNNFFGGVPTTSQRVKDAIDIHIMNTITEEQLRKEFNNIFSGKNMIIATIGHDETQSPTEAEILEIFERVKKMSDEELADIEHVVATKLDRLHIDSLDITTVPGTVNKTVVLSDSITEAYLSNGVKVVFWKKKTERDVLHFMLRRPSGFSVLKDNEIHYSDMLSSCVRHYECDRGSAIVNVEPFEDLLEKSVSDREKLESIMKLFYASLAMTEVDSVAFAEELHELKSSAIKANYPLSQSAYKVSYLPSESINRLTPPTMDELSSYNIDGFCKIAKEYFSNYNGSAFIVQGECDREVIMPLILKYIGALPSKTEPAKRMAWSADHYKTTNSIVVEKIQNPSPICQTNIYYTWEKGFKYSQETHAHNQVLQSVLFNHLLNTLRIQHSDVYTPYCQVSDDLLPINRMKITISYTCDPTQRERIAKDVLQIVNDMAYGNLITQALIDNYIKGHENNAANYRPSDFSLCLDYLVREQDGIVIDESDALYVKKVTPASLKAHLQEILQQGNIHIGYLTTE